MEAFNTRFGTARIRHHLPVKDKDKDKDRNKDKDNNPHNHIRIGVDRQLTPTNPTSQPIAPEQWGQVIDDAEGGS